MAGGVEGAWQVGTGGGGVAGGAGGVADRERGEGV